MCPYSPDMEGVRRQPARTTKRTETMPRDAGRLAPLSVHHAFVVHFRVNAEVAQGRVAGRVEHVASGQSTHFASLDELLAFMGQVLATVRGPPGRRRAG